MVDRPARAFRAVVWLLFWALICIAVAFVLAAVAPKKSHAQAGGFVWSERSSSAPHGRYAVMWNTTGSTITDGTLVMVDTTGTTVTPQIPVGKGFKTWNKDQTLAYLLVGVTLGDVPGYSQGRVLVEGFHNNVLVDASGITAFTRLRVSTTTAGAMGSYALTDSLSDAKRPIAVFGRYKDTSTLRAYCWIRMAGMSKR